MEPSVLFVYYFLVSSLSHLNSSVGSEEEIARKKLIFLELQNSASIHEITQSRPRTTVLNFRVSLTTHRMLYF